MEVNRNELKNTYYRALIEKGTWIENEETHEDEWVMQKVNDNPTGMFGSEILLYCAIFGSQIKNIEELELNELYYLKFVGLCSHEIERVS